MGTHFFKYPKPGWNWVPFTFKLQTKSIFYCWWPNWPKSGPNATKNQPKIDSKVAKWTSHGGKPKIGLWNDHLVAFTLFVTNTSGRWQTNGHKRSSSTALNGLQPPTNPNQVETRWNRSTRNRRHFSPIWCMERLMQSGRKMKADTKMSADKVDKSPPCFYSPALSTYKYVKKKKKKSKRKPQKSNQWGETRRRRRRKISSFLLLFFSFLPRFNISPVERWRNVKSSTKMYIQRRNPLSRCSQRVDIPPPPSLPPPPPPGVGLEHLEKRIFEASSVVEWNVDGQQSMKPPVQQLMRQRSGSLPPLVLYLRHPSTQLIPPAWV